MTLVHYYYHRCFTECNKLIKGRRYGYKLTYIRVQNILLYKIVIYIEYNARNVYFELITPTKFAFVLKILRLKNLM